MIAIFFISFLTFIASIMGTITGFGISTVIIPVLVNFLPVKDTIFLVAIIHWFGNLWKMFLFRMGLNVRLFVLFGVTGLITSYIGASLSLGAHDALLLRLLGIFMVLYSLFAIVNKTFKINASRMHAVMGGSISGFFAGMIGMGGALRSMFLSVFDLPKIIYIATSGSIGLLVDSTRILTYMHGGVRLPQDLAHGLLIFIPVSFLGAFVARFIVIRIAQGRFRQVVALFLLLLGVKLLILPVTH
jgi:uncharacterized membrane protein YfcA